MTGSLLYTVFPPSQLPYTSVCAGMLSSSSSCSATPFVLFFLSFWFFLLVLSFWLVSMLVDAPSLSVVSVGLGVVGLVTVNGSGMSESELKVSRREVPWLMW